MTALRDVLVVAVAVELLDRALQIGVEFRRLVLQHTGENRQQRHRVVAAALRKLLAEVVRPVRVPRLVAVHHHRLEGRPHVTPEMLDERQEHRVHVRLHRPRAHLVRLERSVPDLLRDGQALRARAGVAEAVGPSLRLDGGDVAVEAEIRLRLRRLLALRRARPDHLLHRGLGLDPVAA